jgi:hypothetical protein
MACNFPFQVHHNAYMPSLTLRTTCPPPKRLDIYRLRVNASQRAYHEIAGIELHQISLIDSANELDKPLGVPNRDFFK